MVDSFRAAVTAARRQDGLYFAALLSQQRILDAISKASGTLEGWIYTPAVTVWVFLSQCLSADHSCRDAVARLLAWRVSRGLRSCSADSSAYCTARDHLPEQACRQLMRDAGHETEAQAPTDWRWKGRRALLGDGSTITMPDTPENQAEYPQQPGQAPGCGFPIARIVVVFSLAVGSVLEAAIGPYYGKRTGENSLLRTLHAT
ncbi:MAG TPA: IS4 family transposase, partial [Planctomycetaceae bacterium]|nr:IS4 family transposase [Planctomycetaceae bacterium]